MPSLAFTDFNIACATLGGFVSLFGLVSYLCKETLFLSEALISLVAGATISPSGFNLIDPLHYAHGSPETLHHITLSFSRLVLGVQLVLAGVQLPSRYVLKEWRSLALLLGPGMVGMWLCSSLVIFILVPNLPLLHALAIAACVTPTDPVLSNTIVKGKFADDHVPPALQRIIIAESGANDGLGYPFLFFAIYLIKYTGLGGAGQSGGFREAMVLWFGETWMYTILLSILYGAVIGLAAKELLHWAKAKNYIGQESFLVFAVALALFVIGTCGVIGSDDVLACFVAGNAFTIDDWFRLETKDDSLQPTIDMLLNLSVFMWLGAVAPWSQFLNNDIVSLPRLLCLGASIILFRRIPVILALYKHIPQVQDIHQAAFMGFFGPIGVSAMFYLYLTLEFLRNGILVDGHVRDDVKQLADALYIVVWFLVICSVFVHGLAIPFGKIGLIISRHISDSLALANQRRRQQRAHAVMIHRSPSSGLYLYPPPSPDRRFLRGILSVLRIRETPTSSQEGGLAEHGLRSSLLLPKDLDDIVGSSSSIGSRASSSGGYGAMRHS